jgi:hypothetical protein
MTNQRGIEMKIGLLMFLALGFLAFPWACGKSPTSPSTTPTAVPTATNWANLTSTITMTQTTTATPTVTATITATNLSGTSTVTFTRTASFTPSSYTPTPTATGTITDTNTITFTNTQTYTVTPVPTITPSSTITPNPGYITQWVPANIENPNGLAYDSASGHIYIPEDGGQVQVINTTSNVLHTQTAYNSVPFVEPYGVALCSGGATIFVLDGGSPGNIYAFDSSWNASGSVSIAGTLLSLSGPEGIAVTQMGLTTYVYVSDALNNQVDEFSYDGSSFTAVNQWSVGANSVSFNIPSGLAVDGSGDLYVVDSGHQQIQMYNGSAWSIFASTDNSTNVSDVFGLGIDTAGNVYACDIGNSVVQEFSTPSGGFEAALKGGSGNAVFASPDGIAFMSSPANIIVSDYSNGSGTPYGSGSLVELSP